MLAAATIVASSFFIFFHRTYAATVPSAPTGLIATSASANEIDLSWASSTGSVAVAGYNVYRNTMFIGSTTASSYVDLGLLSNTPYTYAVSAFDGSGDVSATSTSVSATTGVVGGTGASVDESDITQTLYVDAQYGNDSNAGTSAAPYATIGKAVAVAAKNIMGGTKIIINPGIYREALNLSAWSSQTNSAPLIIQAAVPGQAIISGSDVYANWTSNGDGTYSHPWSNSWEYAALPNGWLGQQPIPASSACPGSGAGCLGLRAEMVYVNGIPLTQELSGPLTTKGTFFVTDGNSITIDPPTGTQMSSAEVEVATEQSLITADNVQNLVVRGLVFSHSASGIDGGGGVSIINGKNFLFDNDQFLWNTWEGLFMFNVTNVTIQNVTANHNGEDGMVLDKIQNLLFQNDNASFNNWRGYEAGFTGWAAAGIKVLYIHGATINNSAFSDNQTGGVWFDTDNEDILVSNSTFAENLTNGVDTEDNEGPLVFQNDFFCQNQSNGIDTLALEGAGGLYSRNSSYITVDASTFDRNAVAGLYFGGSNTGRTATNYQTGVVYSLPVTSNVTMKNNLVVAIGTDADVEIPSPYNPIDPWRLSTSTLTSDDNTWYSAGNEPFIIPDAPVLNTAPTTIADTLSQWQVYSGQDADSASNQPTVNCSIAPPPDDTTPPTTPIGLATSTVTSTMVTFSWSPAADNVGVAGYDVYRNGTKIATTTATSYSDATVSSSASYAYTIAAYDPSGNISSQSIGLNVTIPSSGVNTTPPTTSITAPLNGTTASGTMSVVATASDTVGVTEVQLYIDGAPEATDTKSPYTFSLNTTSLANGNHILSTKASDAAGNTAVSGNVTITVSNIAAPPTPTSSASVSFKITGAAVSNITSAGAELTITTNESSSIRVQYGSTTSYGSTTVASPELTTIYENLAGLIPNTSYDFLVLATPEGSTSSVSSGNYTFMTAAPPVTPPTTPPVTAPAAPVIVSGGGGGGGGYVPPITTTPAAPSSTSTSTSISSNAGTATPPSAVYFPRPLILGDTGADVHLLQIVLQNLGFFPASIVPTSYFGTRTQHALLVFQSVHQLAETGSLGPQSEALMNKVANAMASIISSTSSVATAAPVPAPAPATSSSSGLTFVRYLGIGSQGADVTLLQKFLVKDGDYPQAIITGYYGSLTERAVEAFQTKDGIVNYGTPDTTGYGAVGPRTRAALNDQKGE